MNPRQRLQPPVTIKGSFGPYNRRELEAARAQLIRDVYTSNGVIITRVKMKCGILPDTSGEFTGCFPHPVTNVSYESQSCSLMQEDSFPWIKERSTPPGDVDDHIQNGGAHQELTGGYSDERRERNSTYDSSSLSSRREERLSRYDPYVQQRSSWNNCSSDNAGILEINPENDASSDTARNHERRSRYDIYLQERKSRNETYSDSARLEERSPRNQWNTISARSQETDQYSASTDSCVKRKRDQEYEEDLHERSAKVSKFEDCHHDGEKRSSEVIHNSSVTNLRLEHSDKPSPSSNYTSSSKERSINTPGESVPKDNLKKGTNVKWGAAPIRRHDRNLNHSEYAEIFKPSTSGTSTAKGVKDGNMAGTSTDKRITEVNMTRTSTDKGIKERNMAGISIDKGIKERNMAGISIDKGIKDRNMSGISVDKGIKEGNMAGTSKQQAKPEGEDDGIVVSDDDVIDDKPTLNLQETEVECYKCDTCEFLTTSVDSIQKHLKDDLHYCASKYTGITKGDRVIPKYLSKIMAFKNNSGLFNTPVPICPICFTSFSDIHACCSHTQQVHKQTKPVYALGVIRETKIVLIYSKPKCHVCHKEFAKISKLNNHMNSAKHYLYPEPDANEVVMMLCMYCDKKLAHKNICQYQDHVQHSHNKYEKLGMKILYILKPTEVKEMLPRTDRKKTQVLFHKIQALHKLQRESSGKKDRKLKHKINDLRGKYNAMNKTKNAGKKCDPAVKKTELA